MMKTLVLAAMIGLSLGAGAALANQTERGGYPPMPTMSSASNGQSVATVRIAANCEKSPFGGSVGYSADGGPAGWLNNGGGFGGGD